MTNALIVDDNRLNNDVLLTLLENEGINALAIESPRFLEDALSEMPDLDVVFLDLEFPNSDGFELLKSLRTDSRLNGVPIVAYSVHTSEIDTARKAGFHSFLGKPLSPHQFPKQLRRILNNEPVWEI